MLNSVPDSQALARKAINAVQSGSVSILKQLLQENPILASAGIENERHEHRTLLHIATDYPGHFPKVAETILLLIESGADVNARFMGCRNHTETPLHWAASCDDIDAINVLVENGADLEARGGVIGGGTPLSDATAFGQWKAAYRLVELGAIPSLFDMAALDLVDELQKSFVAKLPSSDQINDIFWGACHGGRIKAAQFILDHGANVNAVPSWENLTPLDVAIRSKASELVEWLREQGGKTYKELMRPTHGSS
jgi:ankyrin repeat protein